MTVTWRTSVDVKDGYALVREDGKADTVRYDAATDVFKSDIDISNMFWADMVNLKAGTKYFYTVGNDEFRSEEYYFTTEEENAESFKFMCVSDQQSGEPHDLPDYSSFNTVLNKVLEESFKPSNLLKTRLLPKSSFIPSTNLSLIKAILSVTTSIILNALSYWVYYIM